MQNSAGASNTRQQPPRPEGEITIEDLRNRESRKQEVKKEGEYVDYEEVQ